MTMSAPSVAWFRNDLRLGDNPALTAAASVGAVIPLYILDEERGARPMGGASRWWLDHSLRSLGRDLAAAGVPLVLRRGPATEVLASIVAESGAGAVYWNRLYDPASVARDERIKASLKSSGVECCSFNGALLTEPWEVRTGAGDPYRVFTPFWRAASRLAEEAAIPTPRPPRLGGVEEVASDDIDDWGLHPSDPDWSTGFADWRPGESGAEARLQHFLADAAGAYAEARDRPAVPGTSKLSPHLHFGEISPRQIWFAARAAALRGDVPGRAVEAFLRELGWREFNHHLLFHFPEMTRRGLSQRFSDFPWRDDPSSLKAWGRGMTGFPVVDAGMRELWVTGWMHNRVRMIAASFLVKDLLIDWRSGEAWFWDTLVDADLANNIGGWQWVAGCGADAAPFFRVFNPVLQGEKFDAGGDYVRRWIPELARLPSACIHQPWRAGGRILTEAGVRLGETYPAPIIDHAQARHRALAAYEKSK